MAENGSYRRIIYVDPNDVYDKDNQCRNGIALTPKYEDMCISFNLIIESFSRFRSNSTANGKETTTETDENGETRTEKKTWVVEWGMTRDDMKKKKTSVLQGNMGDYDPDSKEMPKYNYLTTYYTDISFDSYKEKTQIEGLGVESVQISYESWYTPTVTIKFVDVRGSALWGREEALHVDEKLTVDNVFGAFFTIPYPVFRLQVKGFFGKPVTYQLTCSGFKGEFNTNTGNFEAIATFIGYSWSLMTDIPFAYLVAAPYAPYIGAAHWEKKKNSEDWGLWNDGDTKIAPRKLFEIFEDIKSAQPKFSDDTFAATSEQTSELARIQTEIECINGIISAYNAFVAAIRKNEPKCFIDVTDPEEKRHQILLFSDSENFEVNEETQKAYNDYSNKVKGYIENGFSEEIINKNKLPNKWGDSIVKKLTFLKRFKLEYGENQQTVTKIGILNNGTELPNLDIESVKKVNFNNQTNNDAKLSGKMINEVLKGMEPRSFSKSIKPYCYLVNLYDVGDAINARQKELQKRKNEIKDEIDKQVNIEITSILGFKPFIGNIFKIIFCHLETFCHILFEAGDTIDAQCGHGERTPSALGLDIQNTDIVEGASENIVAWPAIYDKGKQTSECGYVSNIENVYGWVGDVSHKFEEEKIVYSIQEGILLTNRDPNSPEYSEANNSFPVTLEDYLNGGSVFRNSDLDSVSNIGAYLALRAANIMGVMCSVTFNSEIISKIGRMDAYSLSLKLGYANFKRLLEGKDKEVWKNIAYCNQSAKEWELGRNEKENTTYHIYESSRDIINGRHPMFVHEIGETNKFVHWFDKNGISYVPNNFKKLEVLSQDFSRKLNSLYFIPYSEQTTDDVTVVKNCMFTADTSKVEDISDYKKYFNYSLFNIIKDESSINTIESYSERLRQGGLKVSGYNVTEKLDDVANAFAKVTNQDKAKYFRNVSYMLSGKLDDKVKKEFKKENAEKYTIKHDWSNRSGNKVNINDDFEMKFNDTETVESSSLTIQQFKVYHLGENQEKNECSIFGCPFYYLQNAIPDKESDRRIRVKALLFLHTFRYNYNSDAVMNVFKNGKTNGCMESVPKAYLLLLGGLLWRKRYYKEHNDTDPILYVNPNAKTEAQTKIKFKSIGVDKTFLWKKDQYCLMRTALDTDNVDYLDVKVLFGGLGDIDYNIENQLIALFENFIYDFSKLAEKFELKTYRSDNGVEKAYLTTDLLLTGNLKNTYLYLYKNNKDFKKFLFSENDTEAYLNISLNGNASDSTTVGHGGFLLLMDEDDSQTQEHIKDLYMNTYIVSDSCYRRKGKETSAVQKKDRIYVTDNMYDAYLVGFTNAVSDIISANQTEVADELDMDVSKEVLDARDVSLSIYYYIKNLWDRWLVMSPTNAYDVNPFFTQNFIFIDSFYKNTFHLLAVNCEKLIDAWQGMDKEASLFHFLGRICSDHTCNFLPVPDFIGFNGQSQEDDIKALEDMFRPMAYNAIPVPSNSNKFIVMYVHTYSSVTSEDNGYKLDSYDIWSHTNMSSLDGNDGYSDMAKALFQTTNDPNFNIKKDQATQEGYNVPSFGISFARQNNHLFKNLKVTMDNPVMTEQSIRTMSEIANKASSAKNMTFVGQDVFNVFTNYSYSVSVEMMGNAQICPLMYFQLMNIPMWRGTYMIYKVVHNMRPGDMTTTFTAMKMSKYAKPFNTQFAIKNRASSDDENFITNGTTSGYDNNISCGDTTTMNNYLNSLKSEVITDVGTLGVKATGFYGKSNEEKYDMCHIKNKLGMSSSTARSEGLITKVKFTDSTGTKEMEINKYVKDDFLQILKEIKEKLPWFSVSVDEIMREGSGEKSRHCIGCAVDLNKGKFGLWGNPWFDMHIKENAPEPEDGERYTVRQKAWRFNGGYNRKHCIWHWGHPVVQIFLKHGWGWGGAYGDVMHFSIDGH